MPNITLTVPQIEKVNNSIDALLNQYEWNVSTAFKLSEIFDSVNPKYNKISKQRDDIIDKYAVKDEDGNYVRPEGSSDSRDQIKINDPKNLSSDLRKLEDQELEINISVNLNLSDFEDQKVKGYLIKDIKPLLTIAD